jgi:hypothetical protein
MCDAFVMIQKANDKAGNGSSRHSYDPRKLAHVESQIKSMLITFFNIKGNVHFEFVPQG